MAIKYYFNREKKQTIAVLDNCKFDAYNRIDKIMNESEFMFCSKVSNEHDKYIMPDTFKATVTCDPRDEYNEEVGKREAKKKLMRNYYKSLDKRLAMFKESVVKFSDNMNRKKF